MTILEITTNQSVAGKALIENGFKEVSNWFNDNIYSKDGENYKIAHPVWTKDLKAVRVEKRCNPDLSESQKRTYKNLIRLGDSKELALKTVLSQEYLRTQECHRLQLLGLTENES